MSTQNYPERSDKEIIKLGFRGRCPRCGIGRIYAKFLKVNDECRNCGLLLSEHDAGDGAVVPALLILGSVIVGLALLGRVHSRACRLGACGALGAVEPRAHGLVIAQAKRDWHRPST